jgi:hypothetical protein
MRNRIAMLGVAMLLAPQVARADYLDVITTRLGDCSLEKYLTLVDEFRGVMKQQKYPYTVEIAVPLINNDLDAVYWIGRTADLASFATGVTRWEGEIAKKGTPEAKVNEKLDACGENVSRSGQVTR